MSATELQFRTATFGGFQKQDVLSYIESSNQAHVEKLEQLQRERDELAREKEELAAQAEQARQQVQALTREKDELAARFSLKTEQICCQAAWMEDCPPASLPFGGELRLLDRSWAAWVYEHYSHAFGGVDYIEGAIDRGMLGAFVDGQPAGFAGFHIEGAIGMLEVLPAYRRQGIGEALLRGVVSLALSRGQYAYGQVFTDNAPSLALQRKVGMAVSKDILFWLF